MIYLDINIFDSVYFLDYIDYVFIEKLYVSPKIHYVESDEKIKNNIFQYIFFEKKLELRMSQEQVINIVKENSFVLYKILNTPSIILDDQQQKTIIEIHSIEMFKLIIMKGYEISNDLLEYVIEKKVRDKKEKVLFLLDNKIVPTNKTFNNLINTHYYYQNYYYSNNNSELINIIVNYGYIPTYENVKEALKKKIIIDNIERFDIQFDISYIHICNDVGLIDPYKTNIQQDIICLENECNKPGNLAKIKHIVNTFNILPNQTCIQNACSYKNNVQTVKFLVSKGAKIDIHCLENTVNSIHSNLLYYIFDQYKNNIPIIDMPPNKTHENKTNDIKTNDNKTNDNKTNDNKTLEIRQHISHIPKDFNAYNKVYSYIPKSLCQKIKLKSKYSDINFIEFRRYILDYLKKHNMIDIKGNITIIEPYLYNCSNTISLGDINEWVYSLLNLTQKTNIINTENKKLKVVKKVLTL
jgi:hypothetical protein